MSAALVAMVTIITDDLFPAGKQNKAQGSSPEYFGSLIRLWFFSLTPPSPPPLPGGLGLGCGVLCDLVPPAAAAAAADHASQPQGLHLLLGAGPQHDPVPDALQGPAEVTSPASESCSHDKGGWKGVEGVRPPKPTNRTPQLCCCSSDFNLQVRFRPQVLKEPVPPRTSPPPRCWESDQNQNILLNRTWTLLLFTSTDSYRKFFYKELSGTVLLVLIHVSPPSEGT